LRTPASPSSQSRQNGNFFSREFSRVYKAEKTTRDSYERQRTALNGRLNSRVVVFGHYPLADNRIAPPIHCHNESGEAVVKYRPPESSATTPYVYGASWAGVIKTSCDMLENGWGSLSSSIKPNQV